MVTETAGDSMWFDETAVEALIELTPTWVAIVLLFVGYLGSIYVVAPTVFVAYVWGDSWRSATWPGILIGAYGLFVSLKAAFFVERPPIDPPFPAETLPIVIRPLYHLAIGFETGTFPSGHALAVTVLWGLIVVDLDVRTLWERLLVAVSVVLLVSASRVLLGVHYIADVVGGVFFGLTLLGVMIALRRRVSNPANATLGLAAIPVLAGFPAGTPLEAGALLAVLICVYVVNRYTDIISADRLTRQSVDGVHPIEQQDRDRLPE